MTKKTLSQKLTKKLIKCQIKNENDTKKVKYHKTLKNLIKRNKLDAFKMNEKSFILFSRTCIKSA